jgi:hypothetical protein
MEYNADNIWQQICVPLWKKARKYLKNSEFIKQGAPQLVAFANSILIQHIYVKTNECINY